MATSDDPRTLPKNGRADDTKRTNPAPSAPRSPESPKSATKSEGGDGELDLELDVVETTNWMKEGFTGQER
jgi:hypothetical protein